MHLFPFLAGIQKNGGRVLLRSHVEEILVEGGRASGVRLRGNRAPGGRPEVIRAKKAVVSNASVWDTQCLLPEGEEPLVPDQTTCMLASGPVSYASWPLSRPAATRLLRMAACFRWPN